MQFGHFLCILFVGLAIPFKIAAQQQISGKVLSAQGTGLAGATIRLSNTTDSTKQHGAISKRDGSFEINDVPKGVYNLRISLIGYAPFTSTATVGSQPLALGSLTLSDDTVNLQAVDVEANVIASEMKGDTAQFNAKAYKTNANATSEELVTKMPGVTVENGTIKAQGEEVKRVLVDGKRFFGDDARQTLQNVPADMVDNVQVYNARTNASMYSGFDDGNTEKTMNLVTKKDRRKGAFGNVLGGYGTDDRYTGSLAANYFDDAQRITILGLTNNINQQNFNVQDLLGSMGISGGRARMMSAGASRPGGGFMLSRMSGGLYMGQSNGISTTHALGTQYSDEWGANTQVSGSYFFNYSDNTNNSAMQREYVNPKDQAYAEKNDASTLSRNHRFNFRLESNLDSMNKLLITPNLSYQSRAASTTLDGITQLLADTLSTTNTNTYNTPSALTAGLDVNYSHTFNAQGRTFAVELDAEVRKSTADGSLVSTNTFNQLDSLSTLDQTSTQKQDGTTYSAEVSWVEPMGDYGLLRLLYEPSITMNDADKRTNEYDSLTNDYSNLLPLLTNTYSNTYTTHLARLTHRYQFANTIITSGIGYQVALLDGDVTYPSTAAIRRTFYNIVPELQIRQRFSEQSEMTLRYSFSTQPPSISQLQNVVDNSNPLQLSMGNPDLDQMLDHSLTLRFRDMNWKEGRTLFGFVSADFYQNYVGTSTTVTARDTTVNNIRLAPGTTITAPVNLDGYVGLHSFFTYGLQADFIKSNLNFNGGVNYTRTPSMVNGANNISNNAGFRLGVYLGSNISEDVDVSVSYDANYNVIVNSLTREQDANYFTHTASGRLVWNLGMLACSTDVNHSMYTGLGEGYDQTYTVWNAGIGLRMFDNAGELRLSVFDLLHQNASVYRTVNPVSIDNTQTQVITRYAMLSFNYRFRSFDQANMPESRPPGPPRH
ncbi:MAG: TonB-dependent receptor [Bradyrhizobiaceae bacterium]|nr:TonB-dependent receptor [Bradyrhizobiaceae bacterium]